MWLGKNSAYNFQAVDFCGSAQGYNPIPFLAPLTPLFTQHVHRLNRFTLSRLCPDIKKPPPGMVRVSVWAVKQDTGRCHIAANSYAHI
jgi:hypothetical protein